MEKYSVCYYDPEKKNTVYYRGDNYKEARLAEQECIEQGKQDVALVVMLPKER